MPERKTIKKAQAAKREGKSASTQAGAFVHEAIDHVRKKKHGAKNAKQAIAIGLSEARRSGVDIADKSKKAPAKKKAKSSTRSSSTAKKASGTKKNATRKASTRKATTRKASSGGSKSRIAAKKVSPTRSKAAVQRLQSEPTNSVSHAALSRHAKKAAQSRSKKDLHALQH